MRRAIKYRLHILLFGFLSITYFGKSVLFPYPLAGDEPNYLMDAISMGLFNNRQSKPLYSDPEIVLSIYPSPILSPHVIGESNVTYHGVGLSLLLIPAVFFAGKVIISKLIVCLITAAAVTLLFSLSRKILGNKFQNAIFFTFIIIGVSAPILFNANLLYPEYLCTLMLALVINILYSKSMKGLVPNIFETLVIGWSISYIWWLNTRYIPLAIAAYISVVVFYMYNVKTKNGDKFGLKIWTLVSVFCANFFLILYFFKSWYGTYNIFFVTQAQPSGLLIGDFAAVYRTAGTYLFGHSEGLVPWAPFIVFAIPGIAILWLRFRANLFFLFFPSVIYFGTIIQAAALGGNTPPMHYIAPLIPFFGIPLSCYAVYCLEKRQSISSLLKLRSVYGSASFFLALSRKFLVLGFIGSLLGWSLLLSLQGTIRQGDTYMRSASQESPILEKARFGVSLWPHYVSPNRDNGSLGVPNTETWIQEGNGLWGTGLSQGYRSSGAYTAELIIKSKSDSISNLVFTISERAGEGLKRVAQENYEILPRTTLKAVVPFQLYMTNEVVWFLQTTNAQNIEIVSSNMTVIGPERPSGYSDLGYTILLLILFSSFYLKQIRINRENLAVVNKSLNASI